jgi:hypothetical protein
MNKKVPEISHMNLRRIKKYMLAIPLSLKLTAKVIYFMPKKDGIKN